MIELCATKTQINLGNALCLFIHILLESEPPALQVFVIVHDETLSGPSTAQILQLSSPARPSVCYPHKSLTQFDTSLAAGKVVTACTAEAL